MQQQPEGTTIGDIVLVTDEDWCALFHEVVVQGDGADLEAFLKRCLQFLDTTFAFGWPSLDAMRLLGLVPVTQVMLDSSLYVTADEPEPVPAVEAEPTPAPTAKAKVPKPDFRIVADGKQYAFKTKPYQPWREGTLRVWVDGVEVEPDGDYHSLGEFTLDPKPKKGSVVKATFDKRPFKAWKKVLRGNGSDDFLITLPKKVWPNARFTVKADSPYGCSAYVYVRQFGRWETQDNLSVSFDGRKTKTWSQNDNDFGPGKQRIWVSTNCPWSLTLTDNILK